jgi:hypothetical protein
LGESDERWAKAEEAYAILLEMQRQEEQAGLIPRPPWRLLDRGGVVFECLGAILLGALMATTALVLVFIVANRVFHLQF